MYLDQEDYEKKKAKERYEQKLFEINERRRASPPIKTKEAIDQYFNDPTLWESNSLADLFI
jgi:hypothetical protein